MIIKKRYIQCVCSLSSCRELKLFPHVSQLKDAFTLELDSSGTFVSEKD